MQTNYKAPLIKSLGEAGFRETDYGYARMTFTQARKSTGDRKVKLWLANDVFEAPRQQQVRLEQRLKTNYGAKYLGGYFVKGARSGLGGTRSFVVIIQGD
jgi:hypothetical protein